MQHKRNQPNESWVRLFSFCDPSFWCAVLFAAANVYSFLCLLGGSLRKFFVRCAHSFVLIYFFLSPNNYSKDTESVQNVNGWFYVVFLSSELQFRIVFAARRKKKKNYNCEAVDTRRSGEKKRLCCANNYLLKHHPITIYSSYKMFEVLQLFFFFFCSLVRLTTRTRFVSLDASCFLSPSRCRFVCESGCLHVCACDNFKIQHLPAKKRIFDLNFFLFLVRTCSWCALIHSNEMKIGVRLRVSNFVYKSAYNV